MRGRCWGLARLGRRARKSAEKPAYLNPNLPAEQRAADLVKRMTLEEKASQLVNQARAIPRLGVPGYDWWSEALHGVARLGATEFPEPIGLAATFDTARIHEMAVDIGTEARIVHVQGLAANGGTADFPGAGFLGAEREHLSRSAMGAGAGDVRRGSIFDGADGRGVCDGDAGRRSALLPGDFDAEAFCRALGTGADAALCRRGR